MTLILACSGAGRSQKDEELQGLGVLYALGARTPNPSLEALVHLTSEAIELRRGGRRRERGDEDDRRAMFAG